MALSEVDRSDTVLCLAFLNTLSEETTETEEERESDRECNVNFKAFP